MGCFGGRSGVKKSILSKYLKEVGESKEVPRACIRGILHVSLHPPRILKKNINTVIFASAKNTIWFPHDIIIE